MSMDGENNKTEPKRDEQAVESGLHASDWMGTCQICKTKRPIGGGLSSMGRKWLYVLLMCEKCGNKQPHKFRLSEGRSSKSDQQ